MCMYDDDAASEGHTHTSRLFCALSLVTGSKSAAAWTKIFDIYIAEISGEYCGKNSIYSSC